MMWSRTVWEGSLCTFLGSIQYVLVCSPIVWYMTAWTQYVKGQKLFCDLLCIAVDVNGYTVITLWRSYSNDNGATVHNVILFSWLPLPVSTKWWGCTERACAALLARMSGLRGLVFGCVSDRSAQVPPPVYSTAALTAQASPSVKKHYK